MNPSAPRVSIVMIFLDAEKFIEEAISSIYAQTCDRWELLLVDDGSADASAGIARAHATRRPGQVRYLRHPDGGNHGMSPSRQLGVRHARAPLIAFLDADDAWMPEKLEGQVALLDAEPRAGAVYGTPLYWHGWTGDPRDAVRDHVPGLGFVGDRLVDPPELLLSTAPLGDAPVPCPSDILIRREAIDRLGGFEPRFKGAYEDVAFFAKLLLHEPVLAMTRVWTRYRIHPDSCMATTVRTGQYHARRLLFLNWFEEYLHRQGLAQTEAFARLDERLAPYRRPLAALSMTHDRDARMLNADPNPVPVDSSRTVVSWATPDAAIGQVWISENGGHETLFGEGAEGSQEAPWIQPGTVYEFRLYGDTRRVQLLKTVSVSRLLDAGVGSESFGSLRRVVPVSSQFGFDRGQPIDRYYIDRFLAEHAADIRGRVLEVGESTYSRRFGGDRITQSDVLHVHPGNPEATIVADLSRGDAIPDAAFDCVLLLQTLHIIFDVPAAIRTLHRILKPGGVVLATFPGISQRSRDEWRDSWYWGFTSLSAGRLFGAVFSSGHVQIATRGNVLAASAFLFGLAASELTPDELDYIDDSYEAVICVRATKPVAISP